MSNFSDKCPYCGTEMHMESVMDNKHEVKEFVVTCDACGFNFSAKNYSGLIKEYVKIKKALNELYAFKCPCPCCGSQISFSIKMIPDIFSELECYNCGLKISENNKEDLLKHLASVYDVENYEITNNGYIYLKERE